MYKRVVFAGVLILVSGMVTALAISHVVNSHEYQVSASFTQRYVGEFVSGQIDMQNSTGVLYISNDSQVVYLVPAAALGLVNNSSAVEYAVVPAQSGNVTYAGFAYSLGESGRLYTNLTGSYYIVAFADIAPSISYDRATTISPQVLSLYNPLTIAGEAMWIIGTLVSSVGFVLPWKKKG